jgi:hypothetical protein
MATTLSRELSGEETSNNKTPNDESAFQNWIRGTDWFKEFKAEYNEEPDLDTKDYDYRAAWKAGVQPERDPYDKNRFHWPSSLPTGEMLKSAEHPTAWKEYFMRDTGVNPDALGLKTPEDANIYLKKNGDQKVPNNKGSSMATTLDRINNPLGPLGLTSLTGSSAKEKPPAPSQAAFPSIERPADPRPAIERQRAEIGVKTENIDAKIIQNLADQSQFQAQQAKQKAESEAQGLRELDTSKKALEKSLYESTSYKTIQEKSRELAEKSTFNPDQQNAQTLAAVFSIIGAAGFLLGGNNKNTAKAALSAMNGMAEGYSKGRDQYAKDQRLAFDANQKALRGTLDSLEKAFTYEIEQNKGNIESATRNAKIAALERDASFINDNIDKYGLVSTLEQLRSNKKQLDTVLGALQKKEDAYAAEMQKEWFANESKKAISAAAQERVRYQEQERTAREQERRQDQERRDIERREDTQRFQRERDQFRLENRPERGQGRVQPSSGAGGAVQFRYNSAMVNAGNQLAIEVGNAADLPAIAAPPGLAEVLTNPSKGLSDAGRAFLSQKITQPESRAMQQIFAGMQRAMTTIEASGRPSGATESAIKEFGKTLPRAGDNKINTYLFLAQTRQVMEILEKDLKAAGATEEQIKQAIAARKEVEDVISWTVKDVNRILSKDGARLVDDRTRDLMKNSQTLGEFNSELRKKPSEGTLSSVPRGKGTPEDPIKLD